MAASNFIPEVWAREILSNLRSALVFAAMCNRNYEGDIAEAGDTVHITDFTDPSVRTYTSESDISVDSLTDGTRQLDIDQAKYFAFDVDDIERRLALPGFVEAATQGAAYNLAAQADSFLSAAMAADVDAGNKLGATAITDPEDAYDMLVALRTKLSKSNCPTEGRWATVNPETYGKLLGDDRFVRIDASGTSAGLRNGQVGRAAGFDVYEVNTLPVVDGDTWTAIAGHPIATTYAEAISKITVQAREKRFGDLVKGLHLYGAKVVRPTCLATADVTVDPS